MVKIAIENKIKVLEYKYKIKSTILKLSHRNVKSIVKSLAYFFLIFRPCISFSSIYDYEEKRQKLHDL